MAKLGIVKNLIAFHGKDMHQHNFKIEFVFEGDVENEMVAGVDFHEIKPFIEEKVKDLDRKYLNDVEGFGRATVENIAIYFLRLLQDKYPVHSVTVWEGCDRYACIYKDDLEKK